jgi:hypothetical protein
MPRDYGSVDAIVM